MGEAPRGKHGASSLRRTSGSRLRECLEAETGTELRDRGNPTGEKSRVLRIRNRAVLAKHNGYTLA